MKLSIISPLILLFASSFAFAGDPFAGASLYTEYCSSCHGADGRGELAGTPTFRGGKLMMKTDSDIKSIIKSGKDMMPGFVGVLNDREIEDVIAYIRTFN